jgi:hypothetical protein
VGVLALHLRLATGRELCELRLEIGEQLCGSDVDYVSGRIKLHGVGEDESHVRSELERRLVASGFELLADCP